MIVITLLPEPSASPLRKGKGGLLLKAGDKSHQISFVVYSVGEAMKMVGHKAIGLDFKLVGRGVFRQNAEHFGHELRMNEAVGPSLGNHGYEIPSLTDVVCCG
jgi:hypothetical protein